MPLYVSSGGKMGTSLITPTDFAETRPKPVMSPFRARIAWPQSVSSAKPSRPLVKSPAPSPRSTAAVRPARASSRARTPCAGPEAFRAPGCRLRPLPPGTLLFEPGTFPRRRTRSSPAIRESVHRVARVERRDTPDRTLPHPDVRVAAHNLFAAICKIPGGLPVVDKDRDCGAAARGSALSR